MKRTAAFVEHLGARTLARLAEFGYALGFFYEVLKETLFFVRRKSVGIRGLTMQILFTGVEALSVIAVLSVALGAVIIVQGLSLLPQFGQGQ
ncbi:MAG: ABC transporter permease, partial [Spirochaetes bacterium]|nr:ABC transporter permease [Spirochaetota bacterium]